MDGEATLLGPSWTHKLPASLGDMHAGTGARQTESSSPSGLILGADAHGPTMANLASHMNGEQPAQNNMDPSSVLALQQNLQRLYGSLGQLGNSASRASLHSILEEQNGGDASNGTSGGVNFMPSEAKTGSDDDLFLLDQPGPSGGGPSPNEGSTSPPQQGIQMPTGVLGESRTLFIRGIEPSIPDDMIREYLECFGDIHSLYTASKHRGYVMVTYHDIRAARLAQSTLVGQTWRGTQLSCQFSPESGSGSGGVTAALLLVAMDGGRALDDAYYTLSAFGELKELRREPTRPNIALAEFFDARNAATALARLSSNPGKGLMAIDAGPSLSNLPAAFSEVGSSWDQVGPAGGMHQPVGLHDLNNITLSMQNVNLGQSNPAPTRNTGNVHSAASDILGLTGATSNAPMYPLRGIQSTGSLALWPQQQQTQMGSSPSGNNSSWLSGPTPGLQQDLLVAQQQAAAVAVLQQNAQLLHQQQQVAQNAAVHAALQQAMLNQQMAAAAALGLHNSGRRGFSEPALGGRLARRPMDPAAEAERRAQQERLYGLDLQRIAVGDDKRTTLMIKNIPNKYTQKMLLALMEERFAGMLPFPFDFFYLPIDFKNRCNVGYAFINMTTPHCIPALVEEFHGRRWPKFNSEKVCRIAYARIQGKNALVQHFQNSSLLHEDKRCRPVLFKLSGEVEPFPIAGEGV